ncbi:hypothetical protein T484DRAFT_3322751 [Baffinella frigidus]|nr:hypothetical protein T484DRAFT_3322751 [Cryptophyta sp. CCMP2293]
METEGWKGFSAAVARVWAGERSHASLVRDLSLDPNTAFFIGRVLEAVALPVEHLAAKADFNSRRAMPRDLEFEGILNTHDALLRQLSLVAKAQSAAALGESSDAMMDEAQEQQANTIIGHMEASGYAPPPTPRAALPLVNLFHRLGLADLHQGCADSGISCLRYSLSWRKPCPNCVWRKVAGLCWGRYPCFQANMANRNLKIAQNSVEH